MCLTINYVLKGQFILAQWQRLGIKFKIFIVGLKVHIKLICPYRAKNRCITHLHPRATLSFAHGLK